MMESFSTHRNDKNRCNVFEYQMRRNYSASQTLVGGFMLGYKKATKGQIHQLFNSTADQQRHRCLIILRSADEQH